MYFCCVWLEFLVVGVLLNKIISLLNKQYILHHNSLVFLWAYVLLFFHVLFSGMANKIFIGDLIFYLGPHVSHVLDVLGICDMLCTVWKWAYVRHMLGIFMGICQA